MNPVLILTRNNLELTKRCVESVRAQDIETSILVIDNGSQDGTGEWLAEALGWVGSISYAENTGVSRGWNRGLELFFDVDDAEHVLVLNQDVILPPWFYRELLSYGEPFVTGIAVDSMAAIQNPPQRMPLDSHPDFSGFMITREAWKKIGRFDERMVSWASDCDYHVRGHRAGVGMWKANLPYFHQGSSTIRLSSPEQRRVLSAQADADREVFRSLYGCLPGTAAYEALFK